MSNIVFDFQTRGLMQSQRVYVLQPDRILLSLLCYQLTDAGFIVEGFHDHQAAFDRVQVQAPAVLVSDVNFGSETSEVLAKIYKFANVNGVVLASQVPSPKLLGLEEKLGTKTLAYINLQLPDSLERLQKAIRATAGRQPIGRFRDDRKEDHALSALSRSQLEITRLIANGFSNQAIAEHRGTTIRAVENLIKRTFQQIGMDSSLKHQSARVMLARVYWKTIGGL